MEKSRIFKQALRAMLLICIILVCTPARLEAAVLAKKVTLNHTEYTLKKSGKVTLKATVTPKNAKSKSITWSSSNKKVATVSDKGKVTAKKNGTTTITAKVKGTKIKATCKITVGTPVTKVAVKNKKVTLEVGNTSQISTTVTPKKASNKKVSYTSNKPKVATVTAKGKIKAVGIGTATITIKAKDGSNKSVKVNVTVKEISVKGITLTPADKTLNTGESVTLSAAVTPKNAANKGVTFKSSNSEVASVDGTGKVTGVGKGNATITVTSKSNTKIKATAAITVQDVLVSAIKLESEELEMKTGESKKLITTVLPENATNKNVTYTSDNETVASVDQEGEITAKAAGKATITVKSADGNKSTACEVTVKAVLVGIKIQTENQLEVIQTGTTEKLIIQPIPESANITEITCTSSDESRASVDNEERTVNGIKNGTVTISVTAKDEYGNQAEGEIDLRVGTTVTGLELGNEEISMLSGDEKVLTYTVLPANANVKQVSFTSANDEIATVDESGLIKAISPGETHITVETRDGAHQKVCNVVVAEPNEDNIKTVSDQESLNAALEEEQLQVLKIAGEGEMNLTLGEGSFPNVLLIIQAPNAHIENYGVFQSIRIEAIGSNTFVEHAAGNEIYYAAESGSIEIGEGGVASLVLVHGTGQLNLTNNGSISQIILNTLSHLFIDGTSSGSIAVTASAAAENTVITTSRNLNISARGLLDLNLLSGSEETIVSVSEESQIPRIQGLGKVPVTIETTGEVEILVGENNGEEQAQKLTVTGKVMTSTTEPASEASLYFIPYRSGMNAGNVQDYIGDGTKQVIVSADGKYTAEGVSIGNYILLVQKDGYQDVLETLILTSGESGIYNAETIFLIKEGEEETGILYGTLFDAQSGLHVPEGITVRIREGKNNVSGAYLSEMDTDEEGKYRFTDLPAGQYTVQVIDNRGISTETYVTTSFNAVVYAGSDTVKNSTITCILESDQVRFVLRWGNRESGASADLDSHLIGPKVDGIGEFHTWYADKSYYDSIQDDEYIRIADLDVDDTSWEGPETTTVYKKTAGEYRFYIHDYSNGWNAGSMQMGNSAATVEVYVGSRLKATYHVPNQAGNLWYVCKYDAVNNVLTPVNEMYDWDDDLSTIGIDMTARYRSRLAEAIQDAKDIFNVLTDEILKAELSGQINTAQTVYDTSDDLETLKNAWTDLQSIIQQYYESVAIEDVSGEGISRYETYDSELMIYGWLEIMPEFTVTVPFGSSFVIEGNEDNKMLTVTGKGGYYKKYDVSYCLDDQLLGVDFVSDGDNEIFDYWTDWDWDDDGEYISTLYVEGINAALSERFSVTASSEDATVSIEDSDKPGYIKKVTISYLSVSRVYYVYYTVSIRTLDITGVSDGDNVIFDYLIDWEWDDDEDIYIHEIYIEGAKEVLSNDFQVAFRKAEASVEIEDSDKTGYVKKITASYENHTIEYYVKYNQNALPYIVDVMDAENPSFGVDIDHVNKEIYAHGINESLGSTLTVSVPDDMKVTINYYWDTEASITVTNAQGTSRTYWLYYNQDTSVNRLMDAEEEEDGITSSETGDNSVEISDENGQPADSELDDPEGYESQD